METLLTNDLLDLMRKIGDPLVDTGSVDNERTQSANNSSTTPGKGAWSGFSRMTGSTTNASAFDIEDLLKDPGTLPDPDLVKTACDLFARYGSEIAAALATGGAPRGLRGRRRSQRARTAQPTRQGWNAVNKTDPCHGPVRHLDPDARHARPAGQRRHAEVHLPEFRRHPLLWAPTKGRALRASLALRMMHSLIRISAATGIESPALDAPGRPLLNQEDLLATLLSFSITVFEVLEQFGINWTAEEQEAYFYVWDRVGRHARDWRHARHPRTHGKRGLGGSPPDAPQV